MVISRRGSSFEAIIRRLLTFVHENDQDHGHWRSIGLHACNPMVRLTPESFANQLMGPDKHRIDT